MKQAENISEGNYQKSKCAEQYSGCTETDNRFTDSWFVKNYEHKP